MGETLKYKLPYPSLSSIPNIPADIKSLADATEAALETSSTQQLNPSQFNVSTPIAKYPMDVSLMALSTAEATAGQWPFNIAAQVITMASASPAGSTPNRATQFWTSGVKAAASNQPIGLFARAYTAAGSWDPWWRVGPPVTGYLDIMVSPNGATKTATIKFPSYSFLQAPLVYASTDDANPKVVSIAVGRPGDRYGFTLYVNRQDSHTTRTSWVANDRVGTSIAVAALAAEDEPASVTVSFRHTDLSCADAALDPHELLVPADQTDWVGAVCAECGQTLVVA